jgi:hypothetical protein
MFYVSTEKKVAMARNFDPPIIKSQSIDLGLCTNISTADINIPNDTIGA